MVENGPRAAGPGAARSIVRRRGRRLAGARPHPRFGRGPVTSLRQRFLRQRMVEQSANCGGAGGRRGSNVPSGGLALAALHEVAGGGDGAVDGAAAALFAAGIAARTRGKVLWCLTRPNLFAPALAQAGLKADRVIYVEGGDEKTVLACCEEGLRHGGLGAVIGEVARLTMTASRRPQLAAEAAGTIGIVLRRWRRHSEASDFGK